MMDYRLAFINFLFPRLFLQQAKAAVIPLMECANHLGPFFWHWLMLLNRWENRAHCLAVQKDKQTLIINPWHVTLLVIRLCKKSEDSKVARSFFVGKVFALVQNNVFKKWGTCQPVRQWNMLAILLLRSWQMVEYLLGPRQSGLFFGGMIEKCLKMAPPGMHICNMWEPSRPRERVHFVCARLTSLKSNQKLLSTMWVMLKITSTFEICYT